jgi:hypothetical protein
MAADLSLFAVLWKFDTVTPGEQTLFILPSSLNLVYDFFNGSKRE